MIVLELQHVHLFDTFNHECVLIITEIIWFKENYLNYIYAIFA